MVSQVKQTERILQKHLINNNTLRISYYHASSITCTKSWQHQTIQRVTTSKQNFHVL